MSESWQQEYEKLTEFIASHPEIVIKDDRIRLPESIRSEFYNRFNGVREEFISEKLPSLKTEAETLSENYISAEKEIIGLMNLDEVLMANTLQTFLHKPMDILIRNLFNGLFDLLKDRTDTETFESESLKSIKTLYSPYYTRGYEKWVILSLLKLLKAEGLLQSSPRRFSASSEATTMIATRPEEPVPEYKESNKLVFKEAEPATLTLPDFIVFSQEIKRFIAIRSEFGKAMGINTERSSSKQWLALGPWAKELLSGLIFIYASDKTGDISLVSDADKVCRPDIVIKCETEKAWYDDSAELEKITLQQERLKPPLGTYLVSSEAVPDQTADNLGDNINIISAGFEQAGLLAVINKLMQQ